MTKVESYRPTVNFKRFN